MAARIRTLNFLPDIFQTTTNSQFLAASLDTIVDQPNTARIEGYIGSKFGYGIDAKDKYVIEPNKTRTDYQLDPGVVFLKQNTGVPQDFISYPGLLDSLKIEGGITNNNNRLFNSQFYSWDSFTNLDKIINFNQYYWLPQGPESVNITTDVVFSTGAYIVESVANGYNISLDNQTASTNPILTLLRGGTYTFTVNQNSQFWIQGEPGITGFDPIKPNVQTRDVLGVTNNGASQGTITFNVPQKNAQDQFNFPGNNQVGVVSTLPFDQINGAKVSELGGIDGVTALEGLTVLFYNTGVPSELGFIGPFYDTTLYDENGGNPFIFPGTPLDDTNFEGGYYTEVASTFYTITYTGLPSDPIIKLVPTGSIPTNEKIIPQFGTQWIGKTFYKNTAGVINVVPYLSAQKDVLYYQDGTSSNKVGLIRIIENNLTNRIDILDDIIGKKNYTSPNGVVFTNGLKVTFSGNIFPESYLNKEFYVEGVGTSIELIDVQTLIAPELFSSTLFTPYDILPYDIGNFDGTSNVPIDQDYITIARNSIDKNAWSRSNRWFHIDVINATAQYNNNPELLTLYASQRNKAKRPIIEFYPNLRLFNSGIIGKKAVDYIDFRATDAFNQVTGETAYYPDTQVYTAYDAIVNANSNPLVTSTTIIVNISSTTGTFEVGQYVSDSTNLLPPNTQITEVIKSATQYTLTVSWTGSYTFGSTSVASVVANSQQLDAYNVFDGARIVFANDEDINVRNKIYVVRFSSINPSVAPVITLTEAEDGLCLFDEQVSINRGFNYAGKDFYYGPQFNIITEQYDIQWTLAQTKITVNQPPFFDVFDSDGISLSNKERYNSSSFTGTKLFSYGIGFGLRDSVLGFPLRYSGVNNTGDISFDVNFNIDTFNYVKNNVPVTENVNVGYIYNYSDLDTFARQTGWQTAVGPSVQYQVFQFEYLAIAPTSVYTCDVPMISESVWPTIQVFVNNIRQSNDSYTVSVQGNNTIVNFTVPDTSVDTIVEILLLSDVPSNQAYYTIPINLNNNPFNENVTVLNIGDIRNQYTSIFFNCPDTTGQVYGRNNYRDLGNVVPYGTSIIQNSASLVLPAAFLRKQNHNLFNALLYNSREYITYKNLLINTVANTSYEYYQTPAQILDDAIDQITATKTNNASFFWSDMLPSKAPYVSNTYMFANAMDVSIFPLSTIYDFTKANYNGVLVYVTRLINNNPRTIQLINFQDYIVSNENKSLTITFDLQPGDQITINEYNQTYGSYVPNTPTKLGFYPSTIPNVVLDTGYLTPTYFIVGHDGSYTKLYGNYDPNTGQLDDFRDQVLLEFEKRIYNNLKVQGITYPVNEFDVLPGFFRNTDYEYSEILEIYSQGFLNWAGQNRLQYKTQFYNPTNEYTFNYNQSGNKINRQPLLQGYWRGIYQYFYDTANPDTMPWQMIGYTDKPTWWESRYGVAPYTSDNTLLWSELAAGEDWGTIDPVTQRGIVRPQFIRPELLEVLPVDTAGNLLSPFISVMGNYINKTFRRDWVVGDVGPVEFSYRRSSSWPFDLMRILALTKPAQFFNLGVDLDNYRYNTEFNQYLVNDRNRLILSNIEIYGNGTPKTSYINWIIDYEKQLGIDATNNVKTLLDNLDVRLVYRLAGFSDKTSLQFFVEKGSVNSTTSSLLIPDESYALILYDNEPFEKIVYSGVIVQLTPEGTYRVYGNSQNNAFFKTLTPIVNGNYDTITLFDVSVKVAKDYSETIQLVPYGTEFYTVQEVAQFMESYGQNLTRQGVLFETIESGIQVNWRQMILEFLYWAQTGWQEGSIVNINPAANTLSVNKDGYIVQPLTIQEQNFILNQNNYPISVVDLNIERNGTSFIVNTLNQGDTIAYMQANISNFEHAIVFNNITLFDDLIYNLVTGLRQNRILTRGTKTAEWNGTIDTAGFILNQDNILEWNKDVKYTKGSIVKYKNKFWTALKIIQPNVKFQEDSWKETDYNEIQKGLLPNTSTRSYESTLYYDVNRANLEQDADLLGFSLIGYRPRDYLALADLTDITQVNVYKNLIKNKGTRNSVNAFVGANLPQGGIKYDVYENWAIKTGEYGGVLNNNFVEIKLDSNQLTGNPSIIGLNNGTYTPGVQQEVSLYSVYNYGRPLVGPDVLPILPAATPNVLLPSAGYVNLDDVKIHSYYYSGMGVNRVPLSRLFVGDYVWLAEYQGTWQIYAPVSIAPIIGLTNNLNGSVNITFETPHNLVKYDPVIIINFDARVNGYYTVSEIINAFTIQIPVVVDPGTNTITGRGVGLRLQNQRISKPGDINNLSLLPFEFSENKVWVDTNNNGDWSVLKKSLNYKFNKEITKVNSQLFGSAVAASNTLGYLISDSSIGEVYRYVINPVTNEIVLFQTYTGNASFGSTIEHSDDIFVITEPTSNTPKINIYQLFDNKQINSLVLVQNSIFAPSGVNNFGSSVAISGDKNWIYVSDIENNRVFVYNKNATTGKYYLTNSISLPNLLQGDNFGFSMSTDFSGQTLVISAPFKDSNSSTDVGSVFVFNRLSQTFEAQFNSLPFQPQTFNLAVLPSIIRLDITDTTTSTKYITTGANSTTAGINLFDPIVLQGSVFGGLSENIVYYISNIVDNKNFSVSSNRYNGIAIKTFTVGNKITVNSTENLILNRPIKFFGNTSNSNIQESTLYYIMSITTDIDGNPAITIKDVNNNLVLLNDSETNLSFITVGQDFNTITGSGFVYGYVQSQPVYVTQNGLLLAEGEYAVIENKLTVFKTLKSGDIINIDSNIFVLAQEIYPAGTQIGEKFGYSLDITKYSAELIIGAPFAVNQTLGEGAVYRYTNSGSKFGIITGTTVCQLTKTENILINGYIVTLPTGGANAVALAINNAKITNIQASASDGKLTIALLDVNLATSVTKLNITAFNSDTYTALGIQSFTLTQTINCPHTQGATQFGHKVKFNEFTSFVVSAPTGTRVSNTTFDFVDDSDYDNDTLFDNNTTQFIDNLPNVGAVYMFDYLANYQESLSNLGSFVYAQSTNSRSVDNGIAPNFGYALDFYNNNVIIGAPNYLPDSVRGQVVIYTNSTINQQDWSVFRESAPVVDIKRIENIQIYDGLTNQTLSNLDYFDPLQGKLLGEVAQNLDYISSSDPASYNSPAVSTAASIIWGAAQIGSIWLNTSNLKFMNYHQNDVVYNSKYWGQIFPGSQVDVYTWIYSPVPPVNYQGPGIPYDLYYYVINYGVDATGLPMPRFYFWVKNSNALFTSKGKTLTDSAIQGYIANPKFTGISYFAPLLPNVFALYNTQQEVSQLGSILHVGYSTGENDDVAHSLYSLIRSNYADDFLPGLPGINGISRPESLYNRLIESLSGVDDSGAVVPDPYLPKLVQSGVLARPRQSFFYNRLVALQNYLEYYNNILRQYPFNDISSLLFLFKQGETNPSNGQPFYDTTNYWEYVNWWAPGYDNSTKSALQVTMYSDLLTLNVSVGTIVKVLANAQGLNEWYIFNNLRNWDRIGLQNGTIQFKNSLWDYSIERFGFGDNFFDTTPYDEYPSEETKYIVRALNEQLPSDFNLNRNQSLVLLFEYIQSETIEYQNYLPWLNKTSLVDVTHTIRELKPLQVYQTDNQDFLSGYINEVKPYHVVIKDFLFQYTGEEIYTGLLTDFDLPAEFNSEYQQFITPQLVYNTTTSINEFLPTDSIWTSSLYNNWYQNFGVTLTGQNDYPITTLTSYVTLNSEFIFVDNPWGFPTNGVIKIFDPNDTTSEPTERRFELIGYSSVDKATNTLRGLTRGVDGTPITVHLPGQQILINLPPVLLLDSGRGYANPPKITAYIDTSVYPAPRRPAQLQAVMNLDTILRIDVIDPGSGYTVVPEIIIEPSATITVEPTNVNINTSTIVISSQIFVTGDLIKYVAEDENNIIGGLSNNEYYYVNALETSPSFVIGLYRNYADAINDTHRVILYTTGIGDTNKLLLTARASCISSALPVRENIITLKYDRIAYKSKVTDWQPAGFYGSFYAGSFNNSEKIASSAITLQNAQPPISSILSSAEGQAFEISEVTNDYNLTWSSRTRITKQTYGPIDILYPNAIRIVPNQGGASNQGAIGPTTGFYIGMPVKFTNSSISEIANETTYYVKEIFDLERFSIADIDGNTINLPYSSTTLDTWICYVGEVVNKTVLTIDYPGILTVTATQSVTNYLTIPITKTGQAGTTGFYIGLPVFFTGEVFGNIVENTPYYITTVVDIQTFTISKTNDPIIINVTDTTTGSNIITCDNTVFLSINDPIIFNNMEIGGVSVSTFGNIVSGVVYYVSEIISPTSFKISTSVNGGTFALTTVSGVCLGTNQKDTLKLSNGSGNMTIYIGLPISPGQITGQQFTFYPTSQQYPNLSGTNTNLIQRTITNTISGSNRVILQYQNFNIDNFYNNLAFTVGTNIGNLVSATPYYVVDFGITELEITNTSSTGNLLTCADTSILCVNMPIVFSGNSLGGVEIDFEYFVNTIVSPTQFTIKETLSGSIFILQNDNGTMNATGAAYVVLSTSQGGAPNLLADASGQVEFNQYIDPVNTPNFDVSYILGGYRTIISDGGAGYAIDNQIIILGANIGGATPNNNLIITVNDVDEFGTITSAILEGTPNQNVNKYYLKVVTLNKCEVYSDPLCTVPVPFDEFTYEGIRFTTVTETSSITNSLTVTDITQFSVNDPVVFTQGTTNVTGGPVVGETYYITSIIGSTIQISTTVGGSPLLLGSATGLSYYMSKSGDYTLLPEPFYFDQSIVRYNNRVYQCIISNNDEEFVIGKWEELISSDRKLNALDRIVGYYRPEKSNTLAWNDYINMPGDDLTQLVAGITYPNSTYFGNAFAPDEEFGLDTILNDQPFYPNDVDTVAISYDGEKFIAASNTPNAAEAILSEDAITWNLNVISNSPANLTDVLYANGLYVITADNSINPIFISQDGISWSSTGRFIPYDGVPYDTTPYDFTSILVESNSLHSVTYRNLSYIAVGENIVVSTDTAVWREKYAFTNGLSNMLYGVANINISNFTGLIAVGKGQKLIGGNATDVSLILQSLNNGESWVDLNVNFTDKAHYGITSGNNIIIIVGENGEIFSSTNGSNYVAEVSGVSENLNSIIYAGGKFIAVGNNGTIITSTDGSTWTIESSGTTQNLNGVTFDNNNNKFVVVGNNNTILISTDYGITWEAESIFLTEPTIYDVQGSSFLDGYGPEELVPGIISDNLNMIVKTRSGTNWDAVEYAHVGYRVVSLELLIGGNTSFSFFDAVKNPADVGIFLINNITGLSTTLYEGISYSINWITQEVVLTNPALFDPADTIRIDVYEVGNGDQLVSANTNINPLILNAITGFNEIELDCNYTGEIYQGSGVVRPEGVNLSTIAIATNSGTNQIECLDVTKFTLNEAIKFQGTVFGNLVADTDYYVKTIGYATNTITVSQSTIGGIAGPVFVLTDATGTMTVDVQAGSGAIWTDPFITHNGTRLIMGYLYNVSQTISATSVVKVNTTSGMAIGDTITFSNTIFGGVILPLTPYNILNIIDGNEIQLEDPLNPGSPLSLTDASGGCQAITHDVTYALSENGITAKLVFTNNYNTNVDYLSYTVFGQTFPEQFGYTVPTTYVTTSSIPLEGPYLISNYTAGDNPENAIVEIDGLRINPSNYTINPINSEITFNTGVIATTGQTIAVTTYNLTERQYFNTQSFTTTSAQSVYDIAFISNTLSLPLATTTITSVSSTGNVISCDSTDNFVVGQTIIFQNNLGTGMGNILVDGTVYFVRSIINSTDFTISETIGGPAFNPGNGTTPLMVAKIGGQSAIRVTTSSINTLVTNDLVRIDNTLGSIQLNNNTYHIHKISSTQFDLYEQPYQSGLSDVNSPITQSDAYISGGYVWINNAYVLSLTTATNTTAGTNLITVSSTKGLVSGTPVIFTGIGFGNIVPKTTYYVKDIELVAPNTFTISATRFGDEVVLTTDTGTLDVTQWEQDNVDRLWVTINGYRVPSSSLYLNPYNYLSILTPIVPGDEILITSMMPSPTPDPETYLQQVNKNGIQLIYRENTSARTWLTKDLYYIDQTIYLKDVTRITSTIEQNVTAPSPVDGVITVGLTADKNKIIKVTVYNATTMQTLNQNQYSYGIFDISPVVNIRSGVTPGDLLTVTTVEGNTIYIDGEEIRFGSVDFNTNTISDLQRGVNGTGVRNFIAVYSTVYSLLKENILNPEEYNNTWNSKVYNTIAGDPLQISETDAAIFLNQDNF